MPAEFTQAERRISLETPLGPDVLLLAGIDLKERLCDHFRGDLELLSTELTIDPLDLLGKRVTVSVERDADNPARQFTGWVTSFRSGSLATRGLRQYQATIASWTWFLTRTRNYRVFQEQKSTKIAETIFQDLGFNDFEFKDGAQASSVEREYCVQFGETAYDFVTRLFEEEGIFWFVRHADKKDILVIGGAAGAFPKCDRETVMYSDGSLREPHIVHWREEVRFDTGKWASTDYNFEKPTDLNKGLGSTKETVKSKFLASTAKSYEIFDYPGRFVDTSRGGQIAKLRVEAIEAHLAVIDGVGNCAEFAVGHKFKLSGYECDTRRNGKEFVLRSVSHRASEAGYVEKAVPNQYINSFEVMPSESTYRPPLTTERPVVDGVQSATIVGPSGEEIYTDKYGRVKVQFHWDRLGEKDEKSSCWVRVAQGWAGEKWGAICLPRIGQEVLVEFINGDPDRPIVVGRVYNADQMPPYDLPDNKTQSGLKTRSTTKGDAQTFNELRFEDKKDSEQIYFHAQKDFERIVEHDDSLSVGMDKTKGSGKDGKGNQFIEVWNDRTEIVHKGKETITIETGDRAVTITKGDELLQVEAGSRTTKVDKGDELLQVGKGNRTVKVETGNDDHEIKGNRTVAIKNGNDELSVKMGNHTVDIAMGKSLTKAMQSIELKVGSNSIKIDQMGVTIKGMMIKVQGTAMADIKAPMTTVKGDAMLTLKGGITMIN